MCLILPPQPRYMFNPCCADKNHCKNMAEEGHAGKILSATSKLRGVLKRKLGPVLRGSHWILDTCMGVQDPEGKTPVEKLDQLRGVSGQDGVHWTPSGYENMAKNISATIIRLQNGLIGKYRPPTDTASSFVSGSFFWRGFCSPIGSKLTKHPPCWSKASRDWTYRAKAPYSSSNRLHKYN